jgi:Rrf2 family protein
MLSTTAQYALRALLILADEPEDRLVLGREIAQRASIPANYLSKVMLNLAGAGLVEAARGSNGGYRLLIPSRDIKLLTVVRLFDRQFAPNACFLGVKKECSEIEPCSAHEAWKGAKSALMRFLEESSLADISAGSFQLKRPARRRRSA